MNNTLANAAACIAALPALAPALKAQPADTTPPTPVWLDIDTANGVGDVDDGLTLIQALNSPEIELVGISTVFGNTDVEKATAVAQHIVERFADHPHPVHTGAASPADAANTDAVRALSAALQGGPPLTILAVGPATNIAALVNARPDLAGNIDRVVLVAGRRPGQQFFRGDQRPETAPPDFNFELDPEAVRTLLEADLNIVLAPWEVSSKITITPDDLEDLAQRGGHTGAWVQRTSQYWLERSLATGKQGFHPYDSLALAHVAFPELVEGERLAVTIDTEPTDRPTLSPNNRSKHFLHARPTDARPQAHRVLYLHTPEPALKQRLLDRLASDRPTPTTDHAGFDHDAYAALLTAAVDDRGLVDYQAIEHNEPLLDRAVNSLATTDLDALTPDQRLATLINAYNAFTLRLILDHAPVDSILDIPADQRWKARRWNLDGKAVSLDELEHRIIRVDYDEPRIHFALVCAAMGCPPLREEPFIGHRLNEQLDDQTRRAHTRDHIARFDTDSARLTLTPLYRYYATDWHGQEGAVRFAARFLRPLYFAQLLGRDISVEYAGYDWSLNQSD